VFLQMTEQTTDDFVQFELFVRPGGFVAGGNAHIHPHQDEHFLIEAGTIRLRVGNEERIYTIGEQVTVPAGTPPRLVECR